MHLYGLPAANEPISYCHSGGLGLSPLLVPLASLVSTSDTAEPLTDSLMAPTSALSLKTKLAHSRSSQLSKLSWSSAVSSTSQRWA